MYALTTLAAALAVVQGVAGYGCQGIYTYGSCEDKIIHHYDPDDGMICDVLDCGGGRAPVKYDVPCCAAYRGTEPCVSSTRYMPCFQKAAPATTAIIVAPTQAAAPPVVTPDVVPAQSPSVAAVPPSSAAAVPAQTSMAAAAPAVQASTSTQATSTAQITSSASSKVASNMSVTTRAVQSGSVTVSSKAVSSTGTNAAGYVQRDSIVALVGVAMGVVAAL